MMKIIIEHKGEGLNLCAFIDGIKVGPFRRCSLLEVDDVPAGQHQFGHSVKESRAVPFHLEEGDTRKIQTSFSWWAWMVFQLRCFLGGSGFLLVIFLVIDFLSEKDVAALNADEQVLIDRFRAAPFILKGAILGTFHGAEMANKQINLPNEDNHDTA